MISAGSCVLRHCRDGADDGVVPGSARHDEPGVARRAPPGARRARQRLHAWGSRVRAGRDGGCSLAVRGAATVLCLVSESYCGFYGQTATTTHVSDLACCPIAPKVPAIMITP